MTNVKLAKRAWVPFSLRERVRREGKGHRWQPFHDLVRPITMAVGATSSARVIFARGKV